MKTWHELTHIEGHKINVNMERALFFNRFIVSYPPEAQPVADGNRKARKGARVKMVQKPDLHVTRIDFGMGLYVEVQDKYEDIAKALTS